LFSGGDFNLTAVREGFEGFIWGNRDGLSGWVLAINSWGVGLIGGAGMLGEAKCRFVEIPIAKFEVIAE